MLAVAAALLAGLSGVADASYRQVCARPTAGHMQCLALLRTDVGRRSQPQVAARRGAGPATAPSDEGYGPSDLQSAYDIAAAAARAGGGETVAVVDAYNDPDIASDLATYRSAWGLPACGTGCFTVLDQDGATSPLPVDAADTGWDVEESLDVDMVSAICPSCRIDLVEADSTAYDDLGKAVDAGVAAGAGFVSNSYGGPEPDDESSLDARYYDHPGVAVTASAGDGGYGVAYPAASQYVTAVGGTSLSPSPDDRGWSETAWGDSDGDEGTGAGCSVSEAKPVWQSDAGCPDRTVSDVSADADPNTGVAVYDSYSEDGWLEVGGTSASSPMIAAVYALAGAPAAGSDPASYPYADPSGLFDVTSGSDGSCSPTYLCTAGPGYDGPTGLGTPDGVAAFTAPVPPTATISDPHDDQTYVVGQSVATAFDCGDGSGLGLRSCDDSSGVVTTSGGHGTLDTASAGGPYTYTVTVTDRDGETAHSSIDYTVVNPPAPTAPVVNPPAPGGSPTTAGTPPTTATPTPTPRAISTGPSGAQVRGALRTQTTDIGTVLRDGGDGIRFDAPTAGNLVIRWTSRSQGSHGVTLVASLTERVQNAESARGRLTLTRAGRRLLLHARSRRIAVTLSFTPTGLPAVVVRSSIMLRR